MINGVLPLGFGDQMAFIPSNRALTVDDIHIQGDFLN
jgi:hypothetical protein